MILRPSTPVTRPNQDIRKLTRQGTLGSIKLTPIDVMQRRSDLARQTGREFTMMKVCNGKSFELAAQPDSWRWLQGLRRIHESRHGTERRNGLLTGVTDLSQLVLVLCHLEVVSSKIPLTLELAC